MNNPDHISQSLETIFWVKILKFFDADPGSGWKKFASGIRDGNTGSTFPLYFKTSFQSKQVPVAVRRKRYATGSHEIALSCVKTGSHADTVQKLVRNWKITQAFYGNQVILTGILHGAVPISFIHLIFHVYLHCVPVHQLPKRPLLPL